MQVQFNVGDAAIFPAHYPKIHPNKRPILPIWGLINQSLTHYTGKCTKQTSGQCACPT